jgi:hypothetical protein
MLQNVNLQFYSDLRLWHEFCIAFGIGRHRVGQHIRKKFIMNIHHVLTAGFFVAACASVSVSAAVISPVSYAMIDGGSGVFPYQDDSYSGTNMGGFLSGGLGELTDGVIASQHWNVTPGPYVGWRFISPEITFNFAPLADLANVTFRFDDANGIGNVFLPDSLSFDFGSGFTAATPTVTSEGVLGVFSYNFTGINASTFTVRIDSAREWVMLTEVSFNGTMAPTGGVPEPASWAMLIAGFGITGAFMRRRARSLAAA